MKVDGACHCGTIRYEAEVEAEKVAVCHCTDCQTMSGSAFRVVVRTLPGSFRLLAGRPKVYVKTAESGRQREQAFCADCGTPVYAAPVGPEPRDLVLRVGTLRQRDVLMPTLQLWARSSQGWIADLANIPAQDTQQIFAEDGRIRP